MLPFSESKFLVPKMYNFAIREYSLYASLPYKTYQLKRSLQHHFELVESGHQC